MFIIYGCGGHGRSVADVLIDNGEKNIVFVDENARDGEKIMNIPVIKDMPDSFSPDDKVILAIGDNEKRSEVAMNNPDWPYASAVANDAYVSRFAEIGVGAFIAHGAYVGPRSVIGEHVIINTHAVVEHDCVVGEFSHIAPGAIMLGNVCIGMGAYVGGGATARNNVNITDSVTVGIGAAVVRDITESGIYAGVPICIIKK